MKVYSTPLKKSEKEMMEHGEAFLNLLEKRAKGKTSQIKTYEYIVIKKKIVYYN